MLGQLGHGVFRGFQLPRRVGAVLGHVGACWGKPVQGVLCRPVMKNAALDYFLPPPFSPPKNGKKEH